MERAVRLIAAARSILEPKGSGWLHAYVSRAAGGDAGLANVRSRLRPAAFKEAMAWGKSNGCRRAVEYAIAKI